MPHPSRGQHNWLIHRIRERFLRVSSRYYRGILYDLGCGEAPHKEYFLKFADEYIGVDWQSSEHELKADIIADLNESLPVSCEVADTVISLSVIEHLARPHVMLREAYRILVPGGVIVLAAPFQWMVHEAPFDYQRFTPYGLRFLLDEAGFQDVQIEPYAGFFTTMVLKTNYFLKRIVRGPRPVRWLLYHSMIPVWFVGQCTAPLLDRLDRDWSLEASAFWVVARKPTVSGNGHEPAVKELQK